MGVGEVLTIELDGIKVEGLITSRNEIEIHVEITSPFKGHSTSRHISTLASPFISFMGDYGDRKAREMLAELYRECKRA